jgi:hypothetical protein
MKVTGKPKWSSTIASVHREQWQDEQIKCMEKEYGNKTEYKW